MSRLPCTVSHLRGAASAIAAAMVAGSAWSAATSEGFIDTGLYRATRADVVATGRACGIGIPLAPPYVLRVGAANAEHAPAAIALLRDDGGVAMPVVPGASPDAYALADLTEPPPKNALGELRVLQRGPLPWIAVDYRYLDSDCRVTGTIVFEPFVDADAAAQLDTLVQAMGAMGRRDALRAAGKSREAMTHGRAAQALVQSALGPGHWLTLNAETNLASLHWDLDEFQAARESNESAITRLAAALGPDHFLVWRARQNLALVLWDLGELDAAEKLLRDAAERYRTLLDPDDVHRLGTLTNLATLVGERGRVVEGERILYDVLLRFERTLGPDHPRTIVTLNNLASISHTAGRIDDALLQYATAVERYLRVVGPRHPGTLRARHNRAYAIARLGRLAEAVEEQREVVNLRRDVLGPRHSETLQSVNILGGMLAQQGAIPEALVLQREVVAGHESSHGPLHYETLKAQAALGALEARSGDVGAGLARIKRAHGLARETLGGGDLTTLSIGASLARAQRKAGELPAARDTLRELVTALEAWRETGASTASARRTLFAPWVPSYKELVYVELALGDVSAAFRQVERSKARVLVETLALRRGEARDVLPAEDRGALARLDRELSEAESAIARAARDPSVLLPLQQRRSVLSDEALAMRQALRARNAKYSALSEPRVLSVAEGARVLPGDAVFVNYVRDGDRILAFTLDRRGRLQGHDLGELPGLDDLVLAYRALLAAPRGEVGPRVWRLADGRYRVALAAESGAVRVSDPAPIGAELAKRLIEPIPELARSRRWIISPDSALALVPFETLPYRGRPLVATREISYTPSLTVLALTTRRGRDYDRIAGRAPLYAMGAAVYERAASAAVASGGSAVQLANLAGALAADPEGVRRAYDVIGARWPELPNSASELRQVAAHFRNAGAVTVRSFDDATEAQLLEDDRRGTLANHRYVLLSAHGYLSTEAPSLSAVVLGQRDVTLEADGYVTAAEWTGYTLRSDLIVISACETGVGKVIEGEGVAGLPYALFVAGNRNALLTLWPVADRSTASFVSRFFGHLRAGLSQSAALTRTKREFASKGRYTHPVHWAPFVLWGA